MVDTSSVTDAVGDYLVPLGGVAAAIGLLFALFGHTLLRLLVIAIGFVAGVAAVGAVLFILDPLQVWWQQAIALVGGGLIVAVLFNSVYNLAIYVAAAGLGYVAAGGIAAAWQVVQEGISEAGLASTATDALSGTTSIGSGVGAAALAMMLTHFAKRPVVIFGTAGLGAALVAGGSMLTQVSIEELRDPTVFARDLGAVGAGVFLVGALFQFWFYSEKRMAKRVAKRMVGKEAEEADRRAAEYDAKFGAPGSAQHQQLVANAGGSPGGMGGGMGGGQSMAAMAGMGAGAGMSGGGMGGGQSMAGMAGLGGGMGGGSPGADAYGSQDPYADMPTARTSAISHPGGGGVPGASNDLQAALAAARQQGGQGRY